MFLRFDLLKIMKKIVLLSVFALLLSSCIRDLPEAAPESVTNPKVVETYHRAVSGDVASLRQISQFYAKGTNGFPKDNSMVLRCKKMMAERGDLSSQRELGLAYLSGLSGVSQNDSEAKRWLSMAAKQGDAQSKRALLLLEKKASNENARARARSYYRTKTQQDVINQTFASPFTIFQ